MINNNEFNITLLILSQSVFLNSFQFNVLVTNSSRIPKNLEMK